MLDKYTYMHSAQIGAPQMGGRSSDNGQLLQVLDACLVDGWGEKAVSSATYADGVVTLTYGSAHPYLKGQIINVSGANQSAINGSHRVVSKTDDTVILSVDATEDMTGVISTKVAPLGFESIFGSTSALKRAYRSKNTDSTQTVLYLDMTYPIGHGYHSTSPATRAMVSLCEDMTEVGVQIGSYTDSVNNYAANPNGSLFWYQSRGSSKASAVALAENQPWVIIGNGSMFYLLPRWSGQGVSQNNRLFRDLYAFGDVPTLDNSDDLYNCIFMGSFYDDDANTQSAFSSSGSGVSSTATAAYRMRAFYISNASGTQGLEYFTVISGYPMTAWESGSDYGSALPKYPLKYGGVLLTQSMYSHIDADNGFRSVLPIIRAIPQRITPTPSIDLSYIDDFLIVGMHNGRSSSRSGVGFFAIDIEAMDYE